jgi:hypothetical protein
VLPSSKRVRHRLESLQDSEGGRALAWLSQRYMHFVAIEKGKRQPEILRCRRDNRPYPHMRRNKGRQQAVLAGCCPPLFSRDWIKTQPCFVLEVGKRGMSGGEQTGQHASRPAQQCTTLLRDCDASSVPRIQTTNVTRALSPLACRLISGVAHFPRVLAHFTQEHGLNPHIFSWDLSRQFHVRSATPALNKHTDTSHHEQFAVSMKHLDMI